LKIPLGLLSLPVQVQDLHFNFRFTYNRRLKQTRMNISVRHHYLLSWLYHVPMHTVMESPPHE